MLKDKEKKKKKRNQFQVLSADCMQQVSSVTGADCAVVLPPRGRTELTVTDALQVIHSVQLLP